MTSKGDLFSNPDASNRTVAIRFGPCSKLTLSRSHCRANGRPRRVLRLSDSLYERLNARACFSQTLICFPPIFRLSRSSAQDLFQFPGFCRRENETPHGLFSTVMLFLTSTERSGTIWEAE
jgi:hypothetical protein